MIDDGFLQNASAIYVGFSGGLDSTVLLHLLVSRRTELPPIQAIHINHGISPNAHLWQNHCENICKSWQIPLEIRCVSLAGLSNLEAVARKTRYALFAEYISPEAVLLTGHHADDQAETLLLQLMRGSSVDGLAGMKVSMPFAKGFLVRPLLSVSRKTLEAYATTHQLSWIEDESNVDKHYARNYLRHGILPPLQQKWPGATEVLFRTANLLQDARTCLDDLALMDLQDAASNPLPLHRIRGLSRERILNSLRYWLKQQAIQLPSAAIMENIYREAIQSKTDATPKIAWSTYIIRRYDAHLFLDTVSIKPERPQVIPWPDFPAKLEAGYGLGVFTGKGKAVSVEIRFRRGGEVIVLHNQTKSLKKLWQAWKVPPWKRGDIPLIFIEGKLAVVVGYAVGDGFEKLGIMWKPSRHPERSEGSPEAGTVPHLGDPSLHSG